MKRFKILAMMLAVIMMISMLAACGGSKTPSATTPAASSPAASSPAASTEPTPWAPKATTLKVLGHSAMESEAIKSAMEKFKTDYPNVALEVTSIPTGEYNNKRAILIAGGEQVDAMLVSSPLDTINLAQSGMIVPMDEYNAKIGVNPEDLLGADVTKMETIDGKIYKLPYTTTAWLLFYNKDLFDEAGIAYPSAEKAMTWSQYRDIAKKLTKGEGADKIYGAFQLVWPQYWYLPAISELGGGEKFYNAEGKANIADSKFVDALKMNYEMQFVDKSLVSYYDVKLQKLAVPTFATGKYGMFFTGSFAINALAKQNLEFKLGIAPMPIPDSADANYKYTLGGSGGFALTRTTKSPDEAALFSAEMVKNFAAVADNIPAYKDDETIDKMSKVFADKYPGHDISEQTWKDIVFGQKEFIAEKITGPACVEYEAIVIEEMEKYYTNAQTLEETIQSIEKRANEAIAQAASK